MKAFSHPITATNPSEPPLDNTTNPPLELEASRSWWLRWGGPFVFFGLLTVFFTYPTIFNFTTAVSGVAVEDRLQNLWNFWWVRQALFHVHNPYLTDMLFFPF